MDTGFWHNRWQKDEIAFHQGKVNQRLLDHWTRLNLPANVRVFVSLCGKALDLVWLRDQGHRVLGIELSPIAVRDFYAENNLTPHISQQGNFERWEAGDIAILLGDFFAMNSTDALDVAAIYDRASLIAFPPAMREDYARHLQAIMPRQAKMLLVTLEYLQAEMDGPPFSVTEAEVRRLYERGYRIEKLSSEGVLDEFPRFQEKGLRYLTETAYRLTPLG